MTQPEALRLADELERVAEYDHQVQAAAELRRLYQASLDLLGELYVLRASKHLRDVTAAYTKIIEQAQPELEQAMTDAIIGGTGVMLGDTRIDPASIYKQPEQEPVAWVYQEGLEVLKSGKPWTAYGSSGEGRIPLYLNDAVAPKAEPRSGESGAGFESLPASPKWQGLTDEELNQIYAEPQTHAGQYARAIEAKLKEKNT